MNLKVCLAVWLASLCLSSASWASNDAGAAAERRAQDTLAKAEAAFASGSAKEAVKKSYEALVEADKAEPVPGTRVRAALFLLARSARKAGDVNATIFAARRINDANALTGRNAWENLPDGGFRHKLTGFVCPASFEGFGRPQLYFYSANGADTSCELTTSAGAGRIRLYLTHKSAGTSADQAINAVIPELSRLYQGITDTSKGKLDLGDATKANELLLTVQDVGFRFGTWTIDQGAWAVKLRIEWKIIPLPPGVTVPPEKLALRDSLRDGHVRDAAKGFLQKSLPTMTLANNCARAAQTLLAPGLRSQEELMQTIMSASIVAAAGRDALAIDAPQARAAGYSCVRQSATLKNGTDFVVYGLAPGATALVLGGSSMGYRAIYQVEITSEPKMSMWVVAAESGVPDRWTPVLVRVGNDRATILRTAQSWDEANISEAIAEALSNPPAATVTESKKPI